MRSGMVRRWAAAVLAGSLLLGGCSFGGDDDETDEPPTTTDAEPPTDRTPDDPVVNVEGATADGADSSQFALRLSEGAPADDEVDPLEVVAGTPLSPADTQAVLDRLPPWDVPDDDVTEFERPAESLPPPLPGEVVDAPFPPPGDGGGGPAEPDGGPLEVVRFQPEGPVDVAPFVTVTFNQPMVPLATLEQLDTADVPLRITPEVEGRWRWIGTRTLRFEVEPHSGSQLDRLPAATEYTLTVPAGTTSTTGGVLGADVTWSFSTPAPSVERFVGDQESLPLDPVFVAVFDQRVDPGAVLESTELLIGGDPVPLRLATDAEIDDDDRARAAVSSALDGRAVAFRPSGELSPDTSFTIRIGPGVPSAEGPRTSPVVKTYDGRTFGSLRIRDTRCDQGDGCTPGAPFVIEFTNALDPEAFDADLIDISPAVGGLAINVYGSVVELVGATTGSTTYTVTFDGSLTDVFGQTLGDDAAVDFRVGTAEPALQGLRSDWITVDPSATTPQVAVSTINHDAVRVRAWAVAPGELQAFREYQQAMWNDLDAEAPEWTAVLDDTIEIDAPDDRWVETTIDLAGAFEQAGSQIVVRVDPPEEYRPDDDEFWRNQPTLAWVQATTLGIDAFFDHEHLVIWTTDLATGEPVGGVPVELIGDGRLATTDEEGLAELEIGDEGVLGLWADTGERTSFLPSRHWQDGWQAQTRTDEARWYVFDDRGVYRPGETARITGWVRDLVADDGFQLRRFDELGAVDYTAWDAQGAEIATGTADVNALGGFNLSIEIPEGANLGPAWIELRAGSGAGTSDHSFSIQEFRRPDFEVTTSPETSPPFVVTDPATVRVDAEYFSGGPLPGAPVEWLVSKRQTTYQPPNWDEFTFGEWIPWWYADDVGGFGGAAADVAGEPCFDCGPVVDTEYEQFSGTTDAGGRHFLRIDFDGDGVDLPTSVTAEATVFDVNRQALAGRSELLVHAADLYVGLRSDRAFVRQGTPIRVDAVVTDIDGGTVPGREVTVTAGRVEHVLSGGEWIEQLADEQTCTFTSSGDVSDGSMQCEFGTEVGGQYRITARVMDDAGGTNRTELTQWVSGGSGPPQRDLTAGNVTIVPDRETHSPGDTAELLVSAPFSPAAGIVTITRGEIVSTQAFEAEDGSAVLEIPIEDAWVPGVDVQVEMVGTAERIDDDGDVVPDAPDRPAFATGRISLTIPPVTRALDVIASPAETELEPGESTTVTVLVRDHEGEPLVGSDVAVVVVDEAVLSLTGYELTDPLDVFYAPIWSQLTAEYMRSSIVLARADVAGADSDEIARTSADDALGAPTAGGEDTAEEAASDEAAGGGGDGAIDLRENFDALAVYAPDETTGEDGTVTVDVPLPDSLTRYRVMAVAIDGDDRFGKGESTITARLPLQVRPSAPRFLNFGDEFELPVVLQNQTDEPLDVDVALEVANLRTTGPVGRTVTVPAGDRIEVRFPLAADEVGTARYRVAAVSGDDADAASGSLPVYTPATAEAFATYGVVDEGAVAQPTLAPTDVFPQFGGLEINTSSTALQALTDAVLYLTEYRYESADALASRIMAVATLRDVLAAFDAEGLPAPAALERAVRRDVDRLVGLQNDDGGFPYWQRGRRSEPWVSIQATHSLVLAEKAGFDVPDAALDRALTRLASIEGLVRPDTSDQVRHTLSAYALSVREQAGQPDVTKATDLFRTERDDLQLDAVAWLWPSITDEELRAEIETRIRIAAVETAGSATFATDYGEDAYLIAHSDRKTDGVILHALISEMPDSDLIPKVVDGLLGARVEGRWGNAHENAFILLAMDRYFDTFEAVTPDFVARAWLGDLYAAEVPFEGRETDQVTTLVPMADVIAAGDTNVVVAKDGDGRLYYRLGLRYAPTDLDLGPRDEGFIVERVYEAVDDPDDVSRSADGTWTIRAGATVRVTLTMVADARRTHVALIDPLPAGLEPLDPALSVTQTIPPEAAESDAASEPAWWPWWRWYDHQNLRDDRAEAFATLLPGGAYEYTYTARATTPGRFVVPPTRAEEIYAPEVFGRSSTDRVVVE